jgi:hypothetical protein
MDALRAKISEEAKPKTVTTSFRNRSGIHTESHQVDGTPETPEEFDQEKKLTKDAGELNSKKEDLQNDVNIGTVTRAAERGGQIDVETERLKQQLLAAQAHGRDLLQQLVNAHNEHNAEQAKIISDAMAALKKSNLDLIAQIAQKGGAY